MFFDLSPLEILVLGGLAVVLFGPDRLPRVATSAARLLRDMHALRAKMHAELLEQLGPDILAGKTPLETPAQRLDPDAVDAVIRPQNSYTDKQNSYTDGDVT